MASTADSMVPYAVITMTCVSGEACVAREHLHPVHGAHAQVGEDDVEGLAPHALDRRGAVLGLRHRVAGLAQHESRWSPACSSGRRRRAPSRRDGAGRAAPRGRPGRASHAARHLGRIAAAFQPSSPPPAGRAASAARSACPPPGRRGRTSTGRVAVDDPLHHRQPEPGAGRAGGEERLEEAVPDLVRDARARCRRSRSRTALAVGRRPHRERAAAGIAWTAFTTTFTTACRMQPGVDAAPGAGGLGRRGTSTRWRRPGQRRRHGVVHHALERLAPQRRRRRAGRSRAGRRRSG